MLATNQAMLHLFRETGHDVRVETEGGVALVEIHFKEAEEAEVPA